ncbi:MAG: methionyl-tRNA formyltransferase [Clostridia bacterium]|nr:methionyl-tRNA formyltransferase [Clostridia bacterium]
MMRNVVFMGTGPFALCALEGLWQTLGSDATLTVYTKEAKKAGRGMKEKDGCVAEFAREKGLPLYQPHTLRSEEAKADFLALEAELCVVASYGLILPKYVLDAPKYGCVCVHASLLPAYRGAAPIHRVILDGKRKTGVTLMQMDEGIDTGAMLATVETEIGETECVGELFDRLAVLGRDLLLSNLEKLENGSLIPTPQDEAGASYAAKITAEDQKLTFEEPTDQVLCRIRGLSPVPCAYCITAKDGKKMKIYSAKRAEGSFEGACGEVVAVKPEVLVKTADGAVALELIQPEGKGRMAARDAVNGRRLAVGDLLS